MLIESSNLLCLDWSEKSNWGQALNDVPMFILKVNCGNTFVFYQIRYVTPCRIQITNKFESGNTDRKMCTFESGYICKVILVMNRVVNGLLKYNFKVLLSFFNNCDVTWLKKRLDECCFNRQKKKSVEIFHRLWFLKLKPFL